LEAVDMTDVPRWLRDYFGGGGGFAAGRDLTGDSENQTVIGIRGKTVAAPASGDKGKTPTLNAAGSAIEWTGHVRHYASFAAVRAATVPAGVNSIDVAYGLTPGDGLGGVFARRADDTTSTDNGDTILVDAAGVRWHQQSLPKEHTPRRLPYAVSSTGVRLKSAAELGTTQVHAPTYAGGPILPWEWDATIVAADDNGGTVLLASGGALGGWRAKYAGPILIEWFGAKGDGATNDAPAIEAACEACPTDGEVTAADTSKSFCLAHEVLVDHAITVRGIRFYSPAQSTHSLLIPDWSSDVGGMLFFYSGTRGAATGGSGTPADPYTYVCSGGPAINLSGGVPIRPTSGVITKPRVIGCTFEGPGNFLGYAGDPSGLYGDPNGSPPDPYGGQWAIRTKPLAFIGCEQAECVGNTFLHGASELVETAVYNYGGKFEDNYAEDCSFSFFGLYYPERCSVQRNRFKDLYIFSESNGRDTDISWNTGTNPTATPGNRGVWLYGTSGGPVDEMRVEHNVFGGAFHMPFLFQEVVANGLRKITCRKNSAAATLLTRSDLAPFWADNGDSADVLFEGNTVSDAGAAQAARHLIGYGRKTHDDALTSGAGKVTILDNDVRLTTNYIMDPLLVGDPASATCAVNATAAVEGNRIHFDGGAPARGYAADLLTWKGLVRVASTDARRVTVRNNLRKGNSSFRDVVQTDAQLYVGGDQLVQVVESKVLTRIVGSHPVQVVNAGSGVVTLIPSADLVATEPVHVTPGNAITLTPSRTDGSRVTAGTTPSTAITKTTIDLTTAPLSYCTRATGESDPDGGTAAILLTDTNDGATPWGHTLQCVLAAPTHGWIVLHAVLKAGTGTTHAIISSNAVSVDLTLATGATSDVLCKSYVKDRGSGWWEVWAIVQSLPNSGDFLITMGAPSSPYIGDGTFTLYVHDAWSQRCAGTEADMLGRSLDCWLRSDRGVTVDAGLAGYTDSWTDYLGQHSATQTTNAYEPAIVVASADNAPAVSFDGTDDGMVLGTTAAWQTGTAHVLCWTIDIDATQGTEPHVLYDDTAVFAFCLRTAAHPTLMSVFDGSYRDGPAWASGLQHLAVVYDGPNNLITWYRNAVSLGTTACGAVSLGVGNVGLMNYPGSNVGPVKGKVYSFTKETTVGAADHALVATDYAWARERWEL
jgi:hypothetical protein